MQKILFYAIGALVIAAIVVLRQHPFHMPDPRADDDHPVHIAMGGHDYVIPRYYLVASPGDDAKLNNTTSQPKHGPAVTQVASFDIVAGLPAFGPVSAANRDAPYGGKPDDKIRFDIANQQAPQPVTLAAYAADLQARNVNYTAEAGPYGLTQEEDATTDPKIPTHHYFGGLYGGQLMITCADVPGLSCSFTYPLGNATVTVAFAKSLLPQWASLYPAAINFVTRFRKD